MPFLILQFTIKDKNEQPNKEVHGVRSEQSGAQEPLFPWSWGASSRQHMDVVTSLEVFQSPLFRDFYGGSIVGTIA